MKLVITTLASSLKFFSTHPLFFYRVYNYKKIEEGFFKESKKAYTVSLISTILFIGVSLLPIVRLFFL